MNLVSAQYSADSIMSMIIERHDLPLESSAFNCYHQALYEYREHHMVSEVAKCEDRLVVLVCGVNHVKNLKGLLKKNRFTIP